MDGLIAAFFLLVGAWVSFRMKWLSFDFLPAFRVLVIYIALPAFVFSTFVEEGGIAIFNAPIFMTFALASLIIYALCLAIGHFFYRWPISHSMLLGHGATAANSLLLGVPILSITFGAAIHPVVAQIVIFENMFLLPAFMFVADYTMGGQKGWRAVLYPLLRNQFLWAILLASLLTMINAPIPSFVIEATNLLGRAAAPVALITVGGILAKTTFGSHLKIAVMTSIAKLVILPILGFLIGRWLGVPQDLLVILVLFMAIPNAVIYPVFGEQVGFADLSNSIFICAYLLTFFTLSAWFILLT